MLYLKNEYENDTFDKKYNALLDEVFNFYIIFIQIGGLDS